MSFIAIAGIFGNSLIVIAVCRIRTLNSVTDYFICSLASADLFVSFFIMPFAIVTEILQGTWLFGETFCSIWSTLDILCCTASIWNLCAISIDRYIAILKPLIYKKTVTPRKCAVGVAVVWLLSSVLAFSQLLWKYLINGVEVPNMCIYAPHKGFRIYASLTSFFIPMSITLAIYCRIIPVAFRQARKISYAEFSVSRSPSQTSNQILNVIQDIDIDSRMEDIGTSRSLNASYSLSSKRTNENLDTMSANSGMDSTDASPKLRHKLNTLSKIQNFISQSHHDSEELSESMVTSTSIHETSPRGGVSTLTLKRSRNKEWKIIKTLVMVVGIFFVCWMPFAVVIAIEPFLKKSVSVQMMSVFLWLGYFNSVSNPVIYVWLNRNYRKAFKRVLFRGHHSQDYKHGSW